MFPLGKLLGLLLVRRTLTDTTIFQQLLMGAAVFILLTILAGMMLMILIVGGLYGSYAALISYGLTPDAAIIVVASATVLLTVLIILLMRVQMHRMHGMIRSCLKQQSPIASQVTGIAESFITGLTQSYSKKPAATTTSTRRKG